ncbi:hypothetical protein E2C01_054736 [Portunus trituberculatus]|uniref:Uncharacterized protein n=1 Tax=Portunus trituberculatus TaxID=210409 RepID=A0A5B7GKG2_PORTR|nr:hypothetical protein [Portunus trituberculatus]
MQGVTVVQPGGKPAGEENWENIKVPVEVTVLPPAFYEGNRLETRRPLNDTSCLDHRRGQNSSTTTASSFQRRDGVPLSHLHPLAPRRFYNSKMGIFTP